jgi:hypothetical protein
MSYCRWSSEDYRCDLYCYETGSQFVTEVASHRIVGDLPHLGDYPSGGDLEAHRRWIAIDEEQMRIVRTLPRAPIGLPHDGASIWVDTLGQFRATLLMLRAEGYRFPDHVLAEVEREIKERGEGGGPSPD